MTCITAQDPQLARLADAIAQRVGPQRFHVWFNNSTKLDLKQDGLEIAVPNDFISEWIGKNFSRPIQEAAQEVLGCGLTVRFNVMPQLFDVDTNDAAPGSCPGTGEPASVMIASMHTAAYGDSHGGASHNGAGHSNTQSASKAKNLALSEVLSAATMSRTDLRRLPHRNNGRGVDPITSARGEAATVATIAPPPVLSMPRKGAPAAAPNSTAPQPASAPITTGQISSKTRLRHDLATFVVGASNQLAYNTVLYVSEFPGSQYNPLFIHGGCGLGKTHLLQGLCKKFTEYHPTKRWAYMTGEEFTNEFLTALRGNKLDVFRRRMRDLDLLVIDDVHFLGGKKATQEEFLHTFNAIEAMGKQVVMASDNHPKMIEDFGESLVNRFVSGMVVRVDPPNFATRCEILRALSTRTGLGLSEEIVGWIARRVTQNVRELEGAVTRIGAYVQLTGSTPDVAMAQESLGELDRQLLTPVKPDAILQAVCAYFGLEGKDLMSGRRQRTISLARSVAMYLVRKTAKLSFPEIGQRMGKRNHSTVISACRRIERAVQRNEPLIWTSAVGDREEEATELLQRLEEHSRAMN